MFFALNDFLIFCVKLAFLSSNNGGFYLRVLKKSFSQMFTILFSCSPYMAESSIKIVKPRI